MKKSSKVMGIVLGLGSLYLATQVTFAQTIKSGSTTNPDFEQVTGKMLTAVPQLKKETPAPTNFSKAISDVKEYQTYVATQQHEKNRPTIEGPATIKIAFGKAVPLSGFQATSANGKKLSVTLLTQVDTKKLGEQEVILKSQDSKNFNRFKTIKVTVVDETAPKLTLKNATFSTTAGTSIDLMSGVTANDVETGDLTKKITHSAIDFSKVGTQTITYSVADNAKHTTKATAKISISAPKVTKSYANSSSASASSSSYSYSAPASAAAKATSSYQANHIYMNGSSVAFANGGTGSGQQIINSNPYGTASTYYGSSFSGTDGSFTHFIGHAPGAFSAVQGLGVGSAITVTDANGTPFTYHVYQAFNLTMTTSNGMAYPTTAAGQNLINALYYNQVGGETIVLQTCMTGNGSVIRFVYAR